MPTQIAYVTEVLGLLASHCIRVSAPALCKIG
jgi:hypothetical protein